MSLSELLLFAGSSLKDFNWKYRETVEKRRKENIKEINSEVDLDGRSVGRGNSAAGLLGRQGGEWTNNGGKEGNALVSTYESSNKCANFVKG